MVRAAFEILLVDLGMPGESGWDLIRKVRCLAPGRGGTIPAAAVSAFARNEDRLRSMEAGFQVHLPKPVEPTRLVEVVASLRKSTVNSRQLTVDSRQLTVDS